MTCKSFPSLFYDFVEAPKNWGLVRLICYCTQIGWEKRYNGVIEMCKIFCKLLMCINSASYRYPERPQVLRTSSGMKFRTHKWRSWCDASWIDLMNTSRPHGSEVQYYACFWIFASRRAWHWTGTDSQSRMHCVWHCVGPGVPRDGPRTPGYL